MDWKLEVVVVPVSDIDRAKRFYHEQVGFDLDHDTQVSDEARIVQVTPKGSGCSITFGTGLAKSEPGSLQGLQLVVSDVEAARAELIERGVDVSAVQHFGENGLAEGHGGDWNSFLFFSDPDGNGWAVQQRPTSA